jgi:hypothetical protein
VEATPVRSVARFVIALSLIAGAFACSGDSLTQSESIAARLAGTWSAAFDTPGNSLILSLSAHDSTVTGTGTFAGEAGPSGTLTGDGKVTGTTIDLDMLYDSGHQMHFRGNLTGFDHLSGIWFSEPVGDPAPIAFDKVR